MWTWQSYLSTVNPGRVLELNGWLNVLQRQNPNSKFFSSSFNYAILITEVFNILFINIMYSKPI
jgi:hypothetical protein